MKRLSGHSNPLVRFGLLAFSMTLLLAGGDFASASPPSTHCLVPELPRPAEDYQATRDRLEAEGRWQPTAPPDLTPPPDPQLGDRWLWYIWDLGGMPVADLKPCSVRGLGDHCYVVVDDEEWNVSIDQVDVDRIVDHFENQSVGQFPDQGIWDLNTSHFGPPPNPLDGLDRVFLLYYRFNISSDGYFWVFDQYPDGSQPWASNEADVVYLATDSSGGPPASDYMLAVAAHEFQHLIHFNQDQNETSWVEEGLGELAMWLFGNPDTISSFNFNPDNSLVVWNGNWADYIKTYLWTLYIYDHYGGQPTIWDLVHNPVNGMPGYQAAVTGQGFNVQMEDVFGDWGIANYLDDTGIPDGQYGYNGETLPPFFPFRTHVTFPASGSASVQAWGTDYIRFQGFEGVPVLDFNGQDLREFRVAMMALDPVLPTVLRFVTLDEVSDGGLVFHQGQGYPEVIMSIANVSGPTSTYTYGMEIVTPTSVAAVPAGTAPLHGYPNPFNPLIEMSFALARPDQVRLAVYDARGQKVAEPAAGPMPAGEHLIRWDAHELPSGVYLVSLEVGGVRVNQMKVSLLK